MATIKAYTDIKQSRKLAEILPIESADMCYIAHSELINIYEPFYKKIDKEDTPCWSLAGLLNVFPKPKIFYSTDKTNRWYCQCWDSDGNFITFTKATNPIDACYEMVLKLNELKML